MFESTGLLRRQPSEEDLLKAKLEEQRLRWVEPFMMAFVVPLSALITGVAVAITDLPGVLGLPLFCVLYGVIGVLALWVYDKVGPAQDEKDLSEYLLLALAAAKSTFLFLILALVLGLVALFVPF